METQAKRVLQLFPPPPLQPAAVPPTTPPRSSGWSNEDKEKSTTAMAPLLFAGAPPANGNDKEGAMETAKRKM